MLFLLVHVKADFNFVNILKIRRPKDKCYIVIHILVKNNVFQVLIVQAAAHTEYLGEIKLYFDDAGNLIDWHGHPHYLGNDVEQGMCLVNT